jgi:RNA polymerase sigma-70 factor (ECF subfamily)
MADAVEGRGGLAALVNLHRAELLRFLAARCGDRAEAEEVLQDLWVKLADAPSGPIGNARAYLFRAANNLVLDRLRGRQRAMRRDRLWLDDGIAGKVAEPEPIDSGPDAECTLLAEEEATVLRRAIDALPPGARRALQLHRFDGHGQAQVAQIMGISRSGVEKHLATAMRQLRAALRDCGYFGGAASDEQGQAGQADGEP